MYLCTLVHIDCQVNGIITLLNREFGNSRVDSVSANLFPASQCKYNLAHSTNLVVSS